jgi:hypothetical protein
MIRMGGGRTLRPFFFWVLKLFSVAFRAILVLKNISYQYDEVALI